MPDDSMRWIALLAVVLAMLNSGFHFHHGDMIAATFFVMAGALLTAVTNMCVRRRVI